MALIIQVKVVPSSGRNDWILDKSGILKCFLKNPPEKGKANKELIKLVSDVVFCPKNRVIIVSGLTSRNKRVKIDAEMSIEEFYRRVGIERQEKLFGGFFL